MIKSTSFQQFLCEKKDNFKNQVKRRANNDSNYNKKKDFDFQLLNEQIKENLLKRSVPLSKEQLQENYRNQYSIPNQIIINHSKTKKNNYSEAFEGKPDQEHKKLMKSFSGANHYKEEDNQENKKPSSMVANKLQKILKIEGHNKLSQHEQRNCLNNTPNIKQEIDLNNTQMQLFLQKIKNNSEKFICDKSAKSANKINEGVRALKQIQQEFLDIKLESDKDCLTEVLNQLKVIFQKHFACLKVEREVFSEMYCLTKIVAESSIKLHKEEILRQDKIIQSLEDNLKASLFKNEQLGIEIIEKTNLVDQINQEKEKLRKIIQKNILEGKNEVDKSRNNNNSSLQQENEKLLNVIKKLNTKVLQYKEKEEKMIAVLVAVKKQGVNIEKIINEGICIDDDDLNEIDQILLGQKQLLRIQQFQGDQGYADDSVVNDSDESSFNYFGKSQAMDSSFGQSIDQPHVILPLDLMQITY